MYITQGEVNIFSCDEIPSGLPEAPEHNGAAIVGHSETGALHIVEGSNVRVYEENEFISWIDARAPAKIVHLRAFDKHSPIDLPAGRYRIARQREYIPEGFRRVED